MYSLHGKLSYFTACGTEKGVPAGLAQFHMIILHILLENYLGIMVLML